MGRLTPARARQPAGVPPGGRRVITVDGDHPAAAHPDVPRAQQVIAYLSPLPSWLMVAGGRVVAALAEAVLVAAANYGIVSAFVPLHYHWSAAPTSATLVCKSAVGQVTALVLPVRPVVPGYTLGGRRRPATAS